jgi:hypothetical protein
VKHQSALGQVAQHAAQRRLVIMPKALEYLFTLNDAAGLDEVAYRLPERASAIGPALVQTLRAALIRSQAHPEHVGAHLCS